MNARTIIKSDERAIAEELLLRCLRSIYDDGGMRAMQAETTRAIQLVAREKGADREGWVL